MCDRWVVSCRDVNCIPEEILGFGLQFLRNFVNTPETAPRAGCSTGPVGVTKGRQCRRLYYRGVFHQNPGVVERDSQPRINY